MSNCLPTLRILLFKFTIVYILITFFINEKDFITYLFFFFIQQSILTFTVRTNYKLLLK